MNIKDEFIKMFLPDTVEDIRYTMINMDITDLGIGDILRNLNTAYPLNGRERNNIISGKTVVCIKCKSELIEPLNGLILIVTNDTDNANHTITSKNYIVAVINEEKIRTEEGITLLLHDLSKYMIHEYKDIVNDFNSLYVKFVYDSDEKYLKEN